MENTPKDVTEKKEEKRDRDESPNVLDENETTAKKLKVDDELAKFSETKAKDFADKGTNTDKEENVPGDKEDSAEEGESDDEENLNGFDGPMFIFSEVLETLRIRNCGNQITSEKFWEKYHEMRKDKEIEKILAKLTRHIVDVKNAVNEDERNKAAGINGA